MRKLTIILLIIIIFMLFTVKLFSDERSEPKDIVIALDKSLSMEEEIEEVKNYVNGFIVDQLIVDDYFLLLTFYRRTEVAIAKHIRSEADKEKIKSEVDKILADGSFTDLGNVLDRLGEELRERIDNGRIKRFYLITDGVHEPTKLSKYYSKNGSFYHEFQDALTEAFQKTGWKMQILAIGDESDVEALAIELKADYIQTDNTPTADELDALVGDAIGTMQIIDDSVKPLLVKGGGKGILTLKVKTDRFAEAPHVIIDSLKLESGNLTKNNILANEQKIFLPTDGEKTLMIPVLLGNDLEPGEHTGIITISYASVESFGDRIDIQLKVNSYFENNPALLILIIAGGLIVLAGLVILAFAILKKFGIGPAGGITFKIIVEEKPLPEKSNKFKLSGGKELFLGESMDIVSIIPKKNAKCIAKLKMEKNGLALQVLNEFRFDDVDKIPADVLNQTITINTLSNKTYHISFKRLV